ncbi:MAG: nuclear transport factor 2 family protein [Xanthobacteraceae bacterium]|nr:nuclear transport factor 2 family protein [Xanthobacteraceae bacterium]
MTAVGIIRKLPFRPKDKTVSTPLRERIYELYRAYAEGRFQLLLDEAIDDEIEYLSSAPQQIFPYFRRGRGKAALLAAWEASRAEYEFLDYRPLLIVADGVNAAAVVVQMRIRHRTTNRVTTLVVADFLRFRLGRIVEFRQFMDTLDAAEQWLGREIDLTKL